MLSALYRKNFSNTNHNIQQDKCINLQHVVRPSQTPSEQQPPETQTLKAELWPRTQRQQVEFQLAVSIFKLMLMTHLVVVYGKNQPDVKVQTERYSRKKSGPDIDWSNRSGFRNRSAITWASIWKSTWIFSLSMFRKGLSLQFEFFRLIHFQLFCSNDLGCVLEF